MNRAQTYTNNLNKRLITSLTKQAKLLKKVNHISLLIKSIDEKITRDKSGM